MSRFSLIRFTILEQMTDSFQEQRLQPETFLQSRHGFVSSSCRSDGRPEAVYISGGQVSGCIFGKADAIHFTYIFKI